MTIHNSVNESGEGVVSSSHEEFCGEPIDGFAIGKRISSSAFSEVFSAERNGEPYIVKFARNNDNSIQQLKHEAAVLKRNALLVDGVILPAHMNVMCLLKDNSDSERPYIVLPDRGASLEMLLKQERCIEWKKAVGWICQLLDGLEYTHKEMSILQGDVAPKNIFVKKCKSSGDDLVTLGDFNLSHELKKKLSSSVFESWSESASVFGTPLYASPEQQGVPDESDNAPVVDARADIFSVGAVLYHMIVGKPPYMKYTNPSSAKIGVPHEIDLVIDTALAQNPNDRYSSAKDMAVALKNVLMTDREYQEARAKKEEEAAYSDWLAVSSYRKAGPCGPGGQSQEKMQEHLAKISEANGHGVQEKMVSNENKTIEVYRNAVQHYKSELESLKVAKALLKNVMDEIHAPAPVGSVPSPVIEQGRVVGKYVPRRSSSWPVAMLAGAAACAVVGGMYQMDVVWPGRSSVVERVIKSVPQVQESAPSILYVKGLPDDTVFNAYNPLGWRDEQKWNGKLIITEKDNISKNDMKEKIDLPVSPFVPKWMNYKRR